MTRYLRYLRILSAALCGIGCFLLVALWIRSYWWEDSLAGPAVWQYGFSCTSMTGRFMIGGGDEHDTITDWDFSADKFDDRFQPTDPRFLPPVFSFHPSEEDGAYIHVPHWFLALIAGSLAFALARRRRYTLRTLLIVVTIISIGLGLIAYYSTHANQGGFGGGSSGGLAQSSDPATTHPQTVVELHETHLASLSPLYAPAVNPPSGQKFEWTPVSYL